MTRYFCGIGGLDANNGTTWALRKLTFAGAEAISGLAGGDEVRFGPGTYRTTNTTTVNGGSVYSTGTVSVTNGSAVVTGSSTSWSSNLFADGQFQIPVLAHGTDGVTNGTTTFTSAAGNFQAGHIGMIIRVNTKAAYVISAVASATSITLAGIDGSSPSPSAASGLTYDVGPSEPIEILSVDSNTQITLKSPWVLSSFTGLSYTAWRDIKFIGDESGTLTDGIGGKIRFTGSDNDQTSTRNNALIVNTTGRTFRGITLDTTSAAATSLTSARTIIEFCSVQAAGTIAITINGASQAQCTVRNCTFTYQLSSQFGVIVTHSSALDNMAHCIVNNIITGCPGGAGVRSDRIGGVLVENNFLAGNGSGVIVGTALTTGQTIQVNNNIIISNTNGLSCINANEIMADYNTVFRNATARTNAVAGTHDVAYTPLTQMPLLTLGLHTWLFGYLDSQSAVAAIAGLNPPYTDIFGTVRTAAASTSYGPQQYVAGQRPVDAGPSHNRKFGGQ